MNCHLESESLKATHLAVTAFARQPDRTTDGLLDNEMCVRRTKRVMQTPGAKGIASISATDN
jgi:hypothetical protein